MNHRIKKWAFGIIVLLFIINFANASEAVICVDQSGAWKVNFTLDGKWVKDLNFIFVNQINLTIPMSSPIVNHIHGKTYYDINFDEVTYFDFERINGSSKFNGAFFIYQNPTGLETNVTCEAN